MSEINTEYLNRCLETLKKSYEMIKSVPENSIEYEMYRNSLVKSFEMTLEQSGKLLKKKLIPYFASKRIADMLSFKDIFRSANKYSLLNEDSVNRWFKYRDNRNNTAHDYGKIFAEQTLSLIEDFIKDTEELKKVIKNDQIKY
ncbi:nucleotidyltransferase substrate binding protein [bacterium]|nr:nucleotidyltransferase substrate binding protein [bacterium]